MGMTRGTIVVSPTSGTLAKSTRECISNVGHPGKLEGLVLLEKGGFNLWVMAAKKKTMVDFLIILTYIKSKNPV